MAYRKLIRTFLAWMTLAMFGLASISLAEDSAKMVDACSDLKGKSIRWIIPFPPGGGYDLYSRMIAPRLEDKLGAEVRIDYVTGAAGMVATKALQSSLPDGRTLALLNGSGFLMALLYGETRVPHPLKDLTLLCRLTLNKPVLFVSSKSSFKTIEDVVEIGRNRSILFGSSGLGSSSFISAAMLHKLLNIRYRVIPNYKSGKDLMLAVVRGEVDAVAMNADSIVKLVESRELKPLLRLSGQPYSLLGWYNELPALDGSNGVAARLAKADGRDAAQAALDARALTFMASASRIIFGPPGMEKQLAECLEKALVDSLEDPELAAQAKKANRSLDPAGSKEASKAFVFLEQTGGKYADYLNREAEALK